MKIIHKLIALITLVFITSTTYSAGPLEMLLFRHARANNFRELKQLLDNNYLNVNA